MPMDCCQATLSHSAFSTQDAWRQGRVYSAQEDAAEPMSSHMVSLGGVCSISGLPNALQQGQRAEIACLAATGALAPPGPHGPVAGELARRKVYSLIIIAILAVSITHGHACAPASASKTLTLPPCFRRGPCTGPLALKRTVCIQPSVMCTTMPPSAVAAPSTASSSTNRTTCSKLLQIRLHWIYLQPAAVTRCTWRARWTPVWQKRMYAVCNGSSYPTRSATPP